MAKGVKRKVRKLLKAANSEIHGAANAELGGFFAAGMASEGWAGGYAQAMSDVLLLLDGCQPNSRYACVLESEQERNSK